MRDQVASMDSCLPSRVSVKLFLTYQEFLKDFGKFGYTLLWCKQFLQLPPISFFTSTFIGFVVLFQIYQLTIVCHITRDNRERLW